MGWEEGMVVVAVTVRNEDDRKGEKRVATEFHPVICVVHDPFTLILSEQSLCWSFQSTTNPTFHYKLIYKSRSLLTSECRHTV